LGILKLSQKYRSFCETYQPNPCHRAKADISLAPLMQLQVGEHCRGTTMKLSRLTIALLGATTITAACPFYSWAQEPATPDAASPAEAGPTAVEFYNTGVSQFEAEEYGQAIGSFTEAIQRNPDFAEAYLYRGTAYNAIEDLGDAIADINRAIELDPELGRAYLLRAEINYRLGNAQQALSDAQLALALDPTLGDARLYEGLVALEAGESQKAIADFTAAIEQDPTELRAYLLRGFAYDQQEDYFAAIADFSYVLEAESYNVIAYIGRGAAYYHEGELREAETDLTRGLSNSMMSCPTPITTAALSTLHKTGSIAP